MIRSWQSSLISCQTLVHVFQSPGELAIRIWPSIEMDELVLCLPGYLADTYSTQTLHRPGVSSSCVSGSACATLPPPHLLADLANVYRLLPITNSSKQQGLKHW